MLYNVEKKKIKQEIDCMDCSFYDKEQKKCVGINKNCFEYNDVLGCAIDGITGLQIDIKKLGDK